jgi:hypothetical protein
MNKATDNMNCSVPKFSYYWYYYAKSLFGERTESRIAALCFLELLITVKCFAAGKR